MSKKPNIKTAAVNDGFLIITLTQSTKPVVWRLELEKAKNASFEIQEKDGAHDLTIKAPRKSLEVIGSFKEQDDAFKALLSLSDALQNNGSENSSKEKNKTKKSEATPEAGKSQSKIVFLLLATCFVIGLFYYYWGHVIPTTEVFETQVVSGSNISDPSSQTGVPVSADDMLRGF